MTEHGSPWLAWQREHAHALSALQEVQRAYHRAVAGRAFASPVEGHSPVEIEKDALVAVDAARRHLDAVRSRQPENVE